MLTISQPLNLGNLLREFLNSLFTFLFAKKEDIDHQEDYGEKGNNASFREGYPVKGSPFVGSTKKTRITSSASRKEANGQSGSTLGPNPQSPLGDIGGGDSAH